MNKKNDIFQQKAQLINGIADMEIVQQYILIEQQLLTHEKTQNLIKLKKQKQKELVNAEKIHKEQLIVLLQEEMQHIEQELFAIPIYQQYLSISADAQDVLSEISEYINGKLEQLID